MFEIGRVFQQKHYILTSFLNLRSLIQKKLSKHNDLSENVHFMLEPDQCQKIRQIKA